MRIWRWCLFFAVPAWASAAAGELSLRVSWGHTAPSRRAVYVRIEDAPGLQIRSARAFDQEAGDAGGPKTWRTQAGGGDADGVDLRLFYPSAASAPLEALHVLWADLIAAADADSQKRWGRDASLHPHAPRLTFLLNEEGTLGFSVTLEQLRREQAFWAPELDVFLAVGDSPVSFAEHRAALQRWEGQRVLDRIQREPEASYEQYRQLWEDMGHPHYRHPQQRGPGHIVCLTWDSAVPKFGVDPGAGVWNDYGNPDRFRLWFDFGDLESGAGQYWKNQSLADGLPVITTIFEREGVRYEVEQFAYPLDGPPAERRGDLRMTLLSRIRLTNLRDEARAVPVSIHHRRRFPTYPQVRLEVKRQGKHTLLTEAAHGRVLLAIEHPGGLSWAGGVQDYQREEKRYQASLQVPLAARDTREFVVKLPSPLAGGDAADRLAALDYGAARAATLAFWAQWVARGARFEVPEKAVNDLFRASLWHALRLPRRHGGAGADTVIDLPYSNFAYAQNGTPWPINQAVYVDYMIHNLRGYHDVSAEELLAQFRQNQEADGHVAGYANWVTYTPSMLYAVARHYLLSGDSAALERLTPYALKAADWSMAQLAGDAPAAPAPWTRGLAYGPLNDGTGSGYWGFNQAYLFAGLRDFGAVLRRIGHPRAEAALRASAAVQEAILRAFGYAAARSPLVQLRDRTWIPYVPADAAAFRRLLEVWYATDVDTGSAHLVRLGAIPPRHPLADWLLHDHEDNLFYKGLGIANEPVYNQHATAYLLRDEPKAAIRTFYSYMASAFSHTVYEPVEHRWTHGQYFGPPSTDGAWFELYRNMLIRETDDDILFLGQATPRRWLERGKQIVVEGAPTRFGDLNLRIAHDAAGVIAAEIDTPGRSRPAAILLRLRHPDEKPLRAVTVNGRPWMDFDAGKEWVRIPSPGERRYVVRASY